MEQGIGWYRVEGGGRVQSTGAAALSYFVVDVGRTLRRHLLDDVDGVSVVSAHLLIVRAVSRVRRPQGDDDVAGLRAIVVGAGEAPASSPLWAGER